MSLFWHHDTYYVAFQVTRTIALSALGANANHYASHEYRIPRDVEFVSALLHASDERFWYDLRIISQPNLTTPHQGAIQIVFLCRMDCDQATAQIHAQSLAHLLNARFIDIVWQQVHDVAPLLQPFAVHHAATLMRRTGFLQLPDQAAPATHIGFRAEPPPHTDNQELFYISSFMFSTTAVDTLYTYLLSASQPIMVSVRMQRTQLTSAEHAFFHHHIKHYNNTHHYPDATRQMLGLYQSAMNTMQLRLRDMAAQLQVTIATSTPLPPHLIDLVGNVMTQPAGGFMSSRYELNPAQLLGGYVVHQHEDLGAAHQALAIVDFCPIPTPSLMASGARIQQLFDITEASLVFRLPVSRNTPLPGVAMQSHRTLPPPTGLSTTGTRIGTSGTRGLSQPIHIAPIDRTRHCYLVGQTGTGKSTVLKSMILDDIANGMGVCTIDPHGDLITDILAQIPAHRRDDVIVIDPTNSDAPIGLNLFEYETQEEREMAIQLFEKIIELLEYAKGTKPEYMGPVFWQHLRNNAYWVTQDPLDPGTVIELYNMYAIKDYPQRWDHRTQNDSKLTTWNRILESNSYHKQGDEGHTSFSYFTSKFEDFIFDTRIRRIFGQKRSTLNFFEAMNSQKIILINLSRGLLSEVASTFIGGVILAKLQQAALKRAELAATHRPTYAIYVDEFQNYTSDSFISLLSESRKYGIALTLANQFLAQIENKRIIQAILGNVGTIIAFRVGLADAETLTPRFAPEFNREDLINLPNWQAYVATQVAGQSQRPFSMHTVTPALDLDDSVAAHIIAQSAQRYGTPRAVVDAIIAQSMQLSRTAPTESEPSVTTSAPITPTTTWHFPKQLMHRTIQRGDRTTFVLDGIWSKYWGDTQIFAIGLPPQITTTLATMPITNMQFGRYQNSISRKFTDICHVNTALDVLNYCRRNSDSTTVYPHFDHEDSQSIREALYRVLHNGHGSAPTLRQAIIRTNFGVMRDAADHVYVWGTPDGPTQIGQACRAIAAGDNFVLMCDHHGVVTAWGDNSRNQCDIPTDLPPIHHIVAGYDFCLALDAHGIGYMWGNNSNGECNLPPPPLRLVSAGQSHTIAVTHDNQIRCWGQNTDGCCDVPLVVRDLITPIVAVHAGFNCSFVLDSNGTVYHWGENHTTDDTFTFPQHGIFALYGYHEQLFLCHNDGRIIQWRTTHQLPSEITSHQIVDLQCDKHDNVLAIYTHTPLVRTHTLPPALLTDVPTMPAHIATRLSELGIATVAVLLRMTDQQLRSIRIIQEYPADYQACISAVQAYCTSHQFAITDWPQQAVNVDTISVTPQFITVMQQSIQQLNMSTHTKNCLRRADINTIGDVLLLTAQQISAIRNLNPKSAKEAIQTIQSYCAHHHIDIGDWPQKAITRNTTASLPPPPSTRSDDSYDFDDDFFKDL
jgi:hypothetical protein